METVAYQNTRTTGSKARFSYIILTGLLAGSLDALAAVFILSHGNAASIFRFISSGIYGKAAFTGGWQMVPLGIALHYLIAITAAAVYFAVSDLVPFFKRNVWLSAVIYGVLIYLFMNVLVFAVSNVSVPPRTLQSVIKNAVILISCIALPIVWLKRLYNHKQ